MKAISRYSGISVVSVLDGTLVGKCEYVALVPGQMMISGVRIKPKGIFRRAYYVAAEAVKVFGDVSIILDPRKDLECKPPPTTPIGMKVLDSAGGLIGKISDCIFNEKDGRISEFVVSSGVYDGWACGRTGFDRCSVAFLSDGPVYITDYSRLKGAVR